MSFLKKLFGGSKETYKLPKLAGLTPEQREQKLNEYAAEGKLTRFKNGLITYGYTKSYTMDVDECPRCREKLTRKYAEVLYATQGRPKVGYAPAAYFCGNCPTVVVDERIIKNGTSEEVEFRGVIGIDTARKPQLFKAWNDKATYYVFDDNKKPIRMKTLEPGETVEEEVKRKQRSPEELKQLKKKRRTVRKSRKVNRKKR